MYLRALSTQFLIESQPQDAIKIAGEKTFAHLYSSTNSHSTGSLLKILQDKYLAQQDEIVNLDPRKLPPSPSAAHCHALRVFLQVQRWRKLDADLMNSSERGWITRDGNTLPIPMTQPVVAPD